MFIQLFTKHFSEQIHIGLVLNIFNIIHTKKGTFVINYNDYMQLNNILCQRQKILSICWHNENFFIVCKKKNQESCNYLMNKTDTGFVKCLLYCELRKMARKTYRNWFCIAKLSLLIQTYQMMLRSKKSGHNT